MEIWVDADLYEFSAAPDFGYRIWEGDDPEVAVVNLDDYRGQEEAISLVGCLLYTSPSPRD